MGSLTVFVNRLERQGIRLTVQGDKIGVSGPKGSLTPEVREQIAGRKAELLAELARPKCGTCRHWEGLPSSAGTLGTCALGWAAHGEGNIHHPMPLPVTTVGSGCWARDGRGHSRLLKSCLPDTYLPGSCKARSKPAAYLTGS